MPSWAATRRASSTSDTLQQPESDSPPHSLSVTPVTSCPSARRRAAATDESTPPLMATSTRISAPSSRSARSRHPASGAPGQPVHTGRDHGDGLVDLGLGGGPPEGEPHRRTGEFDGQAHGGQDMGRLQGPRGAGRARRGAHTVTVEEEQQRLGLHTGEGDMAVVDELAGRVAVGADGAVGQSGRDPGGQPVPQGPHPGHLVFPVGHGGGQGGGHADDAGHVVGAGAQVALLPPAVDHRHELGALPHDEGADALGPTELVGRNGDEAGAASVCSTARGARSATTAATALSGCTVPTSLLASITDTTVVRSSRAAASASRSTTPSASTPTLATRNPSRPSRSQL